MNRLVIFLVLITFAGALYRIFRALRVRYVVHEYQLGLLYKHGRLVKQVNAGIYWLNPMTSSLTILDARRTSLIVAGQEVATNDNVGLKVSLVLSYSIANAETAVHSVVNYTDELYTTAQLSLRTELAKYSADSLFEQAAELSSALQNQLQNEVTELGLTLHSLQIRDLMFASDIKRAFNDVLKARKEAEARLERARGESAALRNLANAAKLFDNNPNLRSLRLMQAIETSQGNGFSLDASLLEPPDNKIT